MATASLTTLRNLHILRIQSHKANTFKFLFPILSSDGVCEAQCSRPQLGGEPGAQLKQQRWAVDIQQRTALHLVQVTPKAAHVCTEYFQTERVSEDGEAFRAVQTHGG
jgi:hypothetical protein